MAQSDTGSAGPSRRPGSTSPIARLGMHRALAETVTLFEAGLARCTRAEDRSLVSDYLSALAPILAAAVRGEDVLARLDSVERLFGNTWLIDDAPFLPALEKWRQFRSEYEQWVFSGMTVNERLCALGLMDEYDRAIQSRDRARLRRILERVKVDAASIDRILKSSLGSA